MKAEEATTISKEKREQLLKEQLGNIHGLIHTTAEKGRLSVWAHSTDYTSSLHTGFLEEVVDELRTEGYWVSTGDRSSTMLYISWGKVLPLIEDELPQLPSMSIKEGSVNEGAFEVGRPTREPNLIKEGGGWIVPGCVIIAGLILLILLIFG
jgi:hypothetical protein